MQIILIIFFLSNRLKTRQMIRIISNRCLFHFDKNSCHFSFGMAKRKSYNGCELVSIRRLPSVSRMMLDIDNGVDEDRLRQRTCSVIRRSSFENSTRSSDILTSTDKKNVPIQISTIIYNETRVEEEKNTNINQIRSLDSNENMWVDVMGVSF